jgi:hypothetical protein
MSSLNDLRKPHPPRKQLLFFSQEELHNEYFAVIRCSWFIGGVLCGVSETNLHIYDEHVVEEFTKIVGDSLRDGADVSAISIASAEELGIEPT